MQRRIFIAGTAALALPALAQVADINDAINKAGRQRMLSQRMSKAYLALVHKVEPLTAQAVLDRSIALFDRQLVELKAFAPAADIRDTYGKLENEWNAFKGVLVGSAPSRDQAGAVVKADATVLALANQGTQQYEAHSGKSVGKLVNIAGRQRMLSQRMAKFYLANALKVDPTAAVAEIAKSRQEFMNALEVLRTAPEATVRIKEEITLADGQWVFFDQGLQRSDGRQQSVKQMADVFVASENLLNSMDRITGLYSALKA